MESDGVAPSDADVQAEAPQETVAAPIVPSITSTVSGLPISPVYAGGGLGFYPTPVSRTAHFRSSANNARPLLPRIKSDHSYVPQRRGYTVQKNMVGDGDRVLDPMDNFKPQSFQESQGAGAVEEHKPENPNKYRTSGKKSYRADNRANSEVASHKQLRYK